MAIRAMARGVPVTAAMVTKFATLTPDEDIDKAVETWLHTNQGPHLCTLAGLMTGRGRMRTTRTPDEWADWCIAKNQIAKVLNEYYRACTTEELPGTVKKKVLSPEFPAVSQKKQHRRLVVAKKNKSKKEKKLIKKDNEESKEGDQEIEEIEEKGERVKYRGR